MPEPNQRRQVGELVPPFEVETLAHGRLTLPDAGLVHLQFRRFAGCPVCNLHLRRFAQAHGKLTAAGVSSVSIFYSSRQAMLPYQHQLPQAVVADPQRRLFDLFRVERSRWAVAHPRAWATAIGGLFSGPTNPLEGGASDGLPADFLIAAAPTPDRKARILALHYGSSMDDQWSVEDVLELAQTHRSGSSSPSPGTFNLTGALQNEQTQ